MVSNHSNESDDLLSLDQIEELKTGIERHFQDSNYHVFFTPVEKGPIKTHDFKFHLCRKLKDGGHWMSQCPIFFNLQMYAQLLQTGKFAYFLETMETEGPVGKKLGFISQEMGREINTLGSKARDTETSSIVVDMKLAVEQFREQVQNVE